MGHDEYAALLWWLYVNQTFRWCSCNILVCKLTFYSLLRSEFVFDEPSTVDSRLKKWVSDCENHEIHLTEAKFRRSVSYLNIPIPISIILWGSEGLSRKQHQQIVHSGNLISGFPGREFFASFQVLSCFGEIVKLVWIVESCHYYVQIVRLSYFLQAFLYIYLCVLKF